MLHAQNVRYVPSCRRPWGRFIRRTPVNITLVYEHVGVHTTVTAWTSC